jgi:hypothetical protein
VELNEIISSLVVNEVNSNIGYLTDSNELKELIDSIADERLSESIDLSTYNINRLPFIGEFFETILIDNDTVITQSGASRQIAKVLQKNRDIIIMTELDIEKIEAVYEPLDFTDFNYIDNFNQKRIYTMKRWFKW